MKISKFPVFHSTRRYLYARIRRATKTSNFQSPLSKFFSFFRGISKFTKRHFFVDFSRPKRSNVQSPLLKFLIFFQVRVFSKYTKKILLLTSAFWCFFAYFLWKFLPFFPESSRWNMEIFGNFFKFDFETEYFENPSTHDSAHWDLCPKLFCEFLEISSKAQVFCTFPLTKISLFFRPFRLIIT